MNDGYKICTETGMEVGVISDYDFMNIMKKQCEDEKAKLNRIQMYEEKKNKDTFVRYLDEVLGKFYFNYYKRLPNIKPQYIFRFLYLCCFQDYKSRVVNNRKLVKDVDLIDLWQLQKTEKNKTKKELIDNELIFIDDEGYVTINQKYCLKGKLKSKKGDYCRMFIDGIKDLYEKANPIEHKNLQMIIELLPYINVYHNIICSNPEEKYIEKVKPLKQKEICELLGKSKPTQLKLLNIKVRDKNAFIKVSNADIKNFYVINPMIYYKGSDVQDLYTICRLFDVGTSV